MAKKAKANPFLMWFLGWAGPAYIKLVNSTTRREVIGQDRFDALKARKDGFIIAFWHSRILMMVPLRRSYPGDRFWFMVSEHRDGDMIVKAVNGFDISFARGSTMNLRKKDKKKGGADALRTLVKALKDGDAVGLPPDGPRGPRQRCQRGIVQLARMSGVPVFPVGYASRRARIFDSWDRFHLPLPWSDGCYVFGEPITVAGESPEQLEAARLEIEAALNHVTAMADEQMGHMPMPPADRPVTGNGSGSIAAGEAT